MGAAAGARLQLRVPQQRLLDDLSHVTEGVPQPSQPIVTTPYHHRQHLANSVHYVLKDLSGAGSKGLWWSRPLLSDQGWAHVAVKCT